MPDTFDKTRTKRFGERGDLNFQKEEQTTDLETLSESVTETAVPFCTCGAPIMTAVGDVYRCVECNTVSCARCRIAFGRYHYCPLCVRQAYGLDKHTYLTLVFIDRGVIDPERLVDVTLDSGGEVFDIEIDAAVGSILDHDYLTSSGGLSANGKEALHLGHAVFGDDGDVQSVLDQLRLREVVSR